MRVEGRQCRFILQGLLPLKVYLWKPSVMDAFCVLWTKSKDVLFGPQTFDENSGKGNPGDYNVNNLLIVAQLTNLFYRKVN